MTGNSITSYILTTTADVVPLSIGPGQRVVIQAFSAIRLAYDEADLANDRNHFVVDFGLLGSGTGNRPFTIEAEAAMTEQRSLFIRIDSAATGVYVWLQRVEGV